MFSKKEEYRAVAYCIIIMFIFCFHFFAAKEIMKEVPPLVLAAMRGLIGGIPLYLMYYKKVNPALNKTNIISVTIIAFLGFFINQIFFMVGLKNSSALNASIIINTIPIASTFMAIMFVLESFTVKKVLGITLGFVSVLILTLQKQNGANLDSSILGDVNIFLNVISFCFAMTLAKKIMSQDCPHELLSVGMLLLGGLFLISISAMDIPSFFKYSFKNLWNFCVMFFEVIISTSVVYYLNFKALQILPPSTTTIFIYFQPPITAILEYFFYNKIPSIIMLPAFLVICFAGYLVVKKPTIPKSHEENLENVA